MTPTPDPFTAGQPSPNPADGFPPPLPHQFRSPQSAFVSAIFGPVMLLMIGILFALDYGGGPGVGKTWPALIIVAGLLKLGEFMGARNA